MVATLSFYGSTGTGAANIHQVLLSQPLARSFRPLRATVWFPVGASPGALGFSVAPIWTPTNIAGSAEVSTAIKPNVIGLLGSLGPAYFQTSADNVVNLRGDQQVMRITLDDSLRFVGGYVGLWAINTLWASRSIEYSGSISIELEA